MTCTQGELVRFEFRSTDATTAAKTSLYTEDGVARPLQDFERVVLREASVHVNNAVNELDLFDDANDNDSVDDGERFLHVGTNLNNSADTSHNVDFGPEGLAGSIGRLPKVLAASAGEVVVTGTAYVIYGKTPSATPTWKSQFGQ